LYSSPALSPAPAFLVAASVAPVPARLPTPPALLVLLFAPAVLLFFLDAPAHLSGGSVSGPHDALAGPESPALLLV
jgi:hypothetical protein